MTQGNKVFAPQIATRVAAIFLAGCASMSGIAAANDLTQGEPSAPPAMFMTAEPESQEPTQSTACEAGETSVFQADSIDDEFGFSIEVCVLPGASEANDSRIAVIETGEGGSLRTACMASACNGVIEYNRYTRPRFTELTLAWTSEFAENRLVESFDAQETDSKPQSSVSHSWQSNEMRERDLEPQESGMAPRSGSLSLMQLEKHLPPNR